VWTPLELSQPFLLAVGVEVLRISIQATADMTSPNDINHLRWRAGAALAEFENIREQLQTHSADHGESNRRI
jgi:hypothetical protein